MGARTYSQHHTVAAREARERGDVDFLLSLLTDTDWLARSAAAQNLGELRSRQAVPALARCLQAADEGLRISALKALAKIGDSSVVEDVFEVATTDESFGVRATAAEALGRLGDRRAIRLLSLMLSDANTPNSYFKWGLRLLVELDGVEASGDLEGATPSVGPRRRLQLKRTIRALRRAEVNRSRNT